MKLFGKVIIERNSIAKTRPRKNGVKKEKPIIFRKDVYFKVNSDSKWIFILCEKRKIEVL